MRTTFIIPDDAYEALRLQAEKERRTITALILYMIEKYLREVQDGE